jgi:hypothetical protein
MSLISFDIGIKNMAYCIFSFSEMNNSPFFIEKWDILNLMDEENTEKYYCTNSLKIKNTKVGKKEKSENSEKRKKKIIPINYFIDSEKIHEKTEKQHQEKEENGISDKKCNKIAKYKKSGKYFCEKCAKSQTEYILPKKQYLPSSLKKMRLEPLEVFAKSISMNYSENEELPKIKREIIDKLLKYFERKCLEPIIERKIKSAGETDLITIGRNMKRLIEGIPEFDNIKTVIIENQISTIATRMKSIQAMLAQTFIMRNPEIVIEFISSSNKLKGFIESDKQEKKEKTEKQIYKKHKNDGINITTEIIQKNDYLNSWLQTFNSSKKKDDLADAFLQGIWFLKNSEKIRLSGYEIGRND